MAQRKLKSIGSALIHLQGMDEYSNILYVKESPAAMSHLAHRVSLDDKYRPESCCIIGNYYSLSSMHEKVSRHGLCNTCCH